MSKFDVFWASVCVSVIVVILLMGIAVHNTTEDQPNAIEWNVSAYCPCEKCCKRFADGITASGHKIQPGDKFVAAPPEIPFGTLIDIPDYGKVPVLDRGGSIKGNKLDVFFHTHQEALQWGRKYLKVKIYMAVSYTHLTLPTIYSV